MALTQIAQVIEKMAKPGVKLGMMAMAVGVTVSIFSSCTKEVMQPQQNKIEQLQDIDLTNLNIEELQLELENLQNQLQNPNLTPEQIEAQKEQMYKVRLRIIDNKASCIPEFLMGQPTQFKVHKDDFTQDSGKLNSFAEWHIETFPEKCLKLQDYTPVRAAYIVETCPEALNWYNEHSLKLIG